MSFIIEDNIIESTKEVCNINNNKITDYFILYLF